MTSSLWAGIMMVINGWSAGRIFSQPSSRLWVFKKRYDNEPVNQKNAPITGYKQSIKRIMLMVVSIRDPLKILSIKIDDIFAPYPRSSKLDAR
jgi:hypothetical protein